jgi:Phosphodiester glycosidase
MAGLLALLPLLPLAAAPPLPPPPPPPPQQAAAMGRWTLPQQGRGERVRINNLSQEARWLVDDGELWLPLELLEGQLGVSRRQGPSGALNLEWFGQHLRLPAERQRSLADEVAVPVAALLRPLGVSAAAQGGELLLTLPTKPVLAIRSRDLGSGSRRVVFDLLAPGLLRSGEGRLLLGVSASPSQQQQLDQLGLAPIQEGPWLSLRAEGPHFSLGEPWRLVLDLAATAPGTAGTAAPPRIDPRLTTLMGQGLTIERAMSSVGGRQVLLNSVRLDPRRVPLELRPLNRPDGMQGLSSLSQLARQEQALIAVNGGYFNRVNRLPLGALRDGGIWLSGPILNRGAMGWEPGNLPSFGRLSLQESVVDGRGQSWALTSLNSGYAQRGIARYTAAWGRTYQPITGEEMAVLLRADTVVERLEAGSLAGGVALRPGDQLLVARGGQQLPWQPGERLQLRTRVSHALGENPYVLGGGPLLLQGGQLVLNGGAEGFSSGFLSQGAPRTVIASDGAELWLITLQGVSDAGPTLLETALLLQQRGLREALNLDGGSSTGLVLGDVQTVKGRGVAAAVHNGLGLVPRGLSTKGGAGPAGSSTLASGP